MKDTLIQQFKETGHLQIHQLLIKKDIEFLLQSINRLLVNSNPVSLDYLEVEKNVSNYGTGWEFKDNLWRLSPRLRRFFLQGPLAECATSFLKSPSQTSPDIALLRDQTYFKSPGSEATPWHQDGCFIPLPDIRSVTFWIPLHTIDPSMSPMHYVDASHKYCWLGFDSSEDKSDFNNGMDDFMETQKKFNSLNLNITKYDDVKAGDVLVHAPWTLHGSPPHQGDRTRLAIVVIYFAYNSVVDLCEGIRLTNPVNTGQARSLRELNQRDLFPSLNGTILRTANSRTPLVRKNFS